MKKEKYIITNKDMNAEMAYNNNPTIGYSNNMDRF